MFVNALICGATEEAGIVRRGMTELGVHSIACSDADSALEKLRHRKYAAVVVDTSADAIGTGFLAEVRALASTRNSIVIAVSSAENSRLDFQRGANFVFEQPLSPTRIATGLRVAHSLMLREQDRYRRLQVELPANVDTGGQISEASVVNLSEGGMAIQLAYHVATGTPVGWSLRLPGEPLHLEGTGTVRWMDDSAKAGIMFTDLSLDTKETLARWLRVMRTR